MEKYVYRVLLTSVGTATAVALIENFKNSIYNFEIIGTDINSYGYTAGSKLVDMYYRVPYASETSYIDSIVDIVKSKRVDLFMPINDTEIKRVASQIDEFPASCRIVIPSLKIIELVQDKLEANEYVSNFGIHVPKMHILTDTEKCIVRDRNGVGSKGVKFYDKYEEVCEIGKNQFIQKFVEGIEYTVDVLSDMDGHPIYIIPRKRLEIKCGVATKSEIVNDKMLICDAKKILSKLKLPGFSNIQFIKDNTGINWFIEINPRFGGFSNSSLLAAPKMFSTFLDIAFCSDSECMRNEIEQDVHWGAVATRYYKDILYEK